MNNSSLSTDISQSNQNNQPDILELDSIPGQGLQQYTRSFDEQGPQSQELAFHKENRIFTEEDTLKVE